MAVRMTEKAAEQFKAACASKSLSIETTKLRVGAEHNEKEGKYVVSLMFDDQEPGQDDVVEDTSGAQLVINRELGEALGEVFLNYREAPQPGFVLERAQ
jgi:Fe-S cluster assembly iron-binding protein IscA